MALARSGTLLQGCNDAQGNPLPLLHHQDSTLTFLVMVATMTAGTAVIMWLGELITDMGVGNGSSLIIFAGIVAAMPDALTRFLSGGGH